ncbi:dihydrodipicolinate synthase family protein [Jiella mangrovi]|uniref:Dihydrodipicolinate synthase family protein n=1 Tax=Jiella mangrovi TaxID=2821407 RepID=A0ABS4BLU2_9HYPH|nr:dihydrodipicolinate synthase family protein [Jiella mangrovi]
MAWRDPRTDDRDGRGWPLDLAATGRHLERCIEAGCEGFVMLGTLGENSSLTADEKVAVVAAAVEAAGGRVQVIAGIAGIAENTGLAAADSPQRMKDAGAAGLMVLPAMVYQQESREAIGHFRTVARAVDLPIMIYNNRVAYKVDLSPEDFAELASEPNIVAVKESSHDSRRITDMFNRLDERYEILCGVDDLALENLLFGAVGWVSGMANCFPHEAVALYRLAAARKVDEAVELYRWFMPLLHLDTEIKLVQYIKLANQMTGYGSQNVRAPRLVLSGAERDRIAAIIQRAIDTRPRLATAA